MVARSEKPRRHLRRIHHRKQVSRRQEPPLLITKLLSIKAAARPERYRGLIYAYSVFKGQHR